MKFSSKVEKCGQSPMRKFHPYAVAAKARGIKVYHLNIGQPDVQTPPAFFEAIRKFEQPVLEYAPSPGIPELIDAIKGYYDKLDMHFDKSEIYITTGGSEALAITLQCILDDGDEILIPEPFYPNYNTMVRTCGASITPIPTCPEEGYHYAEREKIEPLINEHTRAIMVTNPGNPTGVVLTDDEMKMLVDLAKKHDLFLIGDEAYREFVYGGRCSPSAPLPRKRRRTSSSSTPFPSAFPPAARASAASSPRIRSCWATRSSIASPAFPWPRSIRSRPRTSTPSAPSTLPPCATSTRSAVTRSCGSCARSPASSSTARRARST